MSKLGRKGGMMVCATMASFSLLLLAAANNVAMIYAGRICSGICTGIFTHLLKHLTYFECVKVLLL